MGEVDWVRVWTSSIGTGCLAAIATFPAVLTATSRRSLAIAVLTSALTGLAVTLKTASAYLADPRKPPTLPPDPTVPPAAG